MFRLQQIGRESGDCTAPYKVILERPCTLREFISYILSERAWDWGDIYDVTNNGADSIWLYATCPRYRYSHGKIEESIPEEILKKKVKSGNANGGWTLMDYYLVLED